MKEQKIRIRLKAYDYKLLDRSVEDIVETAKGTGARVAGPIPSRQKSTNTVLTGPLMWIKSRESNLKSEPTNG